MLRKFLTVLLCAFSVALQAEVSIGGQLMTYLKTEKNVNEANDRENTSTTWEFKLIPSVIIIPGMSNIEIVPSAGMGVRMRSWDNENQQNPQEGDETEVSFGGGCGIFYRAVEGDVLRLSLGPDCFLWFTNPDGDDNFIMDMTLGLPVDLDFLLTDRLFIRAGNRPVFFHYQRNKHNDNFHESVVEFFNINTLWLPSLGFYVTF